MPRTPISQTLGALSKLATLVTPEATAELSYAEVARERLTGMIDELNRLIAERAFHQARKQEATQRINQLLDDGRRTASALRVYLKEHLGPGNEELAAFGIQPFRGRKKRRNAESAEASSPSIDPAP
jgi:hypothetical protein